MTEKNEKQLSNNEIQQVVGGGESGGASGDWGDEGGGKTVSWARLVCPVCHGAVKLVRTRSVTSRRGITSYVCRNCGKSWSKSELVEEP